MARIINFLYLFWINLRRNFLKEIALGLGVVLATTTLIIGTSLGDGIEGLYRRTVLSQIPVDQIKINGTMEVSRIGAALRLTPLKIDPNKKVNNIKSDFIELVKSWPEVSHVTPLSRANFPISLCIVLPPPLGEGEFIFLEPPVVGIPNSLAQDYLRKHLDGEGIERVQKRFPGGFKQHEGVVPVLIPAYVGEISKDFMKTNALPYIDLVSLGNFVDVELMLNESIIWPRDDDDDSPDDLMAPIQAKIIGYTDMVLTSGIAIPQEVLEEAKRDFLPKEQAAGYESLIIHVKSPKLVSALTERLTPLVEERELELEKRSLFKRIADYIDQGIRSFRNLVAVFSSLILLIAGVAVFYGFLYLFIRREGEMGLYRFFGGTRVEVMAILVLEAAFVGLLCAAIGYGISYYVLAHYIPGHFKEFTRILPESVRQLLFRVEVQEAFQFDHWKNVRLSMVSVLFCMASAFLPALVGSVRGIRRR